MSNQFIDEVLPKLTGLQNKLKANEDIAGKEIADLKAAIDSMPNATPNKQDLVTAGTDCAICLGCGFFHPGALAFAAVAAG